MAYSHIFPKIDNFFFCIPLRLGLIIVTILSLVTQFYDMYKEYNGSHEFHIINTIMTIPTILFCICLFKPIRVILYFYRYFVVVVLGMLVMVTIASLFLLIGYIKDITTIIVTILIYAIILIFVTYYYICSGSYAEKAIDETDGEAETRALEEK